MLEIVAFMNPWNSVLLCEKYRRRTGRRIPLVWRRSRMPQKNAGREAR